MNATMSGSRRVLLNVIAKCVGEDGWVVDVAKDGELALRDAVIKNPLGPDQLVTCRWYLEQYVQVSPFSADKATEAESLLSKYPDDLLRQLPLRDLVLPELETGERSGLDTVLLHIDVSHDDKGGSKESIHGLFWETLESPALWSHPRWEVAVSRSVWPREGVPSLTKVDAWLSNKATTTELNVLLVIARDLSQDPSKYSDVDPSLATNVLLDVRRRLAMSYRPVRLNIEMVRPGTWNAFKKHLQDTDSRRGRGYFHIVHFDMHGLVGLRSGTRAGVLHFAAENSDGTSRILGDRVGEVLGKHGISLAILNACDSAKACYGDGANVSKQFMRHGVRGVVGMSFKVSSAAAGIFLHTLYQALLLDGTSLSASAAAARKALRLSTVRPARYSLQRRMKDDFVAVAYGRDGEDLFLVKPPPPSDREVFPSVTQTAYSTPAIPHPCGGDPVIGREFDLLRLERLLARGRVVFLAGLCGVGKTAFLNYAASIWKSTHYIDAAVVVDFAMNGSVSGEDFLLCVANQLISQLGIPSLLSGIPDRELEPCDRRELHRALLDVISGIKCVIFLESLETAPAHPLPESLHDTPTIETVPYIKSLLDLATTVSGGGDVKIVFTHRRVDPKELEDLVDHRFGPYRQMLGGLNLADALDLVSSRQLQSDKRDMHEWTYEDADWLDSTVQLLKGIPSALLSVLPLQKALGLSWRQFYLRLHSGLFKSVADLDQSSLRNSPIAEEIRNFSRTFVRSHFFLLCLISNYWHESIGLAGLVASFNAVADNSLRQEFQQRGAEEVRFWASCFRAFVLDRGYIRPGIGDDDLEVHPKFTIIGRAYLFDFISLPQRVKMKTMFCRSLEPLLFSGGQNQENYRVPSANALSALEFCLLEVPADKWPLVVFGVLLDQGDSHLPPRLQTLLRDKVFQLIELIPRKIPQLEDRRGHLAFMGVTLQSLVFTGGPGNHVLWTRVLELSDAGIDFLLSLPPRSDAESRLPPESHLLLVATLSLIGLGRYGEAKTRWEKLKAMEGKLNLPALPCGEKDDTEEPKTQNHNGHEAHMEERDPLSDRFLIVFTLLKCFEHILPTDETAHPEPWQGLTLEEQINDILEDTRAPPASKLDQIDIDEFNQVLVEDQPNVGSVFVDRSKEGRKALEALEDLHDSGQWEDACQHHLGMVRASLGANQFQAARKHMESVREILQKAGSSESLLNATKSCERRIFTKHLVYYHHVAMFPPRLFSDETAGEDAWVQSRRHLEGHSGLSSAVLSEADGKEALEGSPKGWWLWLSRSLGIESPWVDLVYDNRERYAKEAELLDDIVGALKSERLDNALSLLGPLEALCRDSVFVDCPIEISPLQCARDAMEATLEQRSLLAKFPRLWKEDLGASMEIIDRLGCRPRFGAVLTESNAQRLRHAASMYRLTHFRVELHEAAMKGTMESLQEAYQDLKRLSRQGHFSLLQPGVILEVMESTLRSLFKRAVNERRFEDGMAACDEYLDTTREKRREYPRSQDECLDIRAYCESSLLEESLAEAEDALDFDRCLQLLGKLQAPAKGQTRTLWPYSLGPNAELFLRQAYRDGCLDCAMWVRGIEYVEDPLETKKENAAPAAERARLPKRRRVHHQFRRRIFGVGLLRQRTPTPPRRWPVPRRARTPIRTPCGHDRWQFKRPFGCRHRCSEGFCFLN